MPATGRFVTTRSGARPPYPSEQARLVDDLDYARPDAADSPRPQDAPEADGTGNAGEDDQAVSIQRIGPPQGN